MTSDEFNDYRRGPEPGSGVKSAPPPWQPAASRQAAREWAEICHAAVDDAIARRDAAAETEGETADG